MLDDSLVSFGYFEYFSGRPISGPFDLMARCLFRGSAVALNSLYPGIDLMIPLVLKDGRISFLGVQVKFVKEDNVKRTVKDALEKMNFSYIFEGLQSDRPFALIILALGKYEKHKVYISNGRVSPHSENRASIDSGSEVSQHPEKQASIDKPAVLVFEGVRESGNVERLFDIAPTDVSYRGINPEYLEQCDYMQDLIRETPLLQEESKSNINRRNGTKINRPKKEATAPNVLGYQLLKV